jgi:hypothetical protein
MNKQVTNPVLFYEKQRFNQWCIWLLLIGINGFFVYTAISHFIYKQPVGDNPLSDIGFLIMFPMLVLFNLFCYSSNLETKITPEGVFVKLFPFHTKFKHIAWDRIEKCYVREYKPIREFGGWGLRYGFSGQAYNVRGNKGLQIEYKNGKNKLLIGTQKHEELKNILKQVKVFIKE